MAKRRPPDLEPTPAEFVLGREEPDADDGEPEQSGEQPPPQPASRAPATRPKLTRGDRFFIVGLGTVVLAGGALYVSWDDIKAQYERRFHAQRYWAKQVAGYRFAVQHGELLHRECLVDLDAARSKEPIRAAMDELVGVSSSNARSWAADQTAAQEETCSVLADMVKHDRERLTAAEQELARVGSR